MSNEHVSIKYRCSYLLNNAAGDLNMTAPQLICLQQTTGKHPSPLQEEIKTLR